MQEAIVAVVVAAAVITLLKRYLPLAARRAVAAALAALLRRIGCAGWAARLQAGLASSPPAAGACSGCSGCTPGESKPQARQFTVSLESLRRTLHK